MIKPIFCLDFETTALTRDGGEPIEIGAILMDPQTFAVQAEFQAYIKPSKNAVWDPAATAVNNLSPEYIEEWGQPWSVVEMKLATWLNHYKINTPIQKTWWTGASDIEKAQLTPLGQNITYDLDILAKISPILFKLMHFRHIDTMQFAYLINLAHQWIDGSGGQVFRDPKLGIPSISLKAQAATFGIDYSGAHSAIIDCRICCEVFRRHVLDLVADLRNSREYTNQKDQKKGTP